MNTTIRVLGSGAKPQLPGKFLRICRAKFVYLVAQNSSVPLVLHGKSAYYRKKNSFFAQIIGGAPPPQSQHWGGTRPGCPPIVYAYDDTKNAIDNNLLRLLVLENMLARTAYSV